MVISLKNVSKAFAHKRVYRALSFAVEEGELIGLSGENGIGKTTLLKLVSGLIAPDSGEISLFDKEVGRHRSRLMGRVGLLLEGSRNLYWRLTGMQNIRYFSGLKGRFGAAVERAGAKWLAYFNLSREGDAPVYTYSKGMKQKLSLACALTSDPDLLLLDEPFLGLDDETERKLEGLLRQLASEEKKTLLISSHDDRLLGKLATRRVRLVKSEESSILEEL